MLVGVFIPEEKNRIKKLRKEDRIKNELQERGKKRVFIYCLWYWLTNIGINVCSEKMNVNIDR